MFEWIGSLHTAQGISDIIGAGGLIALIAIIFAETGLLVGFFLPGDSLLVTAGVLANPANPHHVPSLHIGWMNLLLIIAAITGDQLNFYLGSKTGDAIWKRPDSRFYKRKHMEEAHEFYVKYGAMAIVGARFLPILRTFVPFIAGVAKMPYASFVKWNIIGGIVWVTSLLWVGYYLGQTPLANRLDKIIVIVVIVSFLPIVYGIIVRYFKQRKAARLGAAEGTPPGDAPGE